MNTLYIFLPVVPSVGKHYTINLRLLLNETLSAAINGDPLAALIIAAVLTKFILFLNSKNSYSMDRFFRTRHLYEVGKGTLNVFVLRTGR